MSDNFPGNPTDSNLPEIGMSDPNRTSPNLIQGGSFEIPTDGAFKITKTDMGGESGKATGASFDESLSSMKDRMPTPAPGNGSGALTDNKGTGNSSGIPEAQEIPIMTFGDPLNGDNDFRTGQKARNDFK